MQYICQIVKKFNPFIINKLKFFSPIIILIKFDFLDFCSKKMDFLCTFTTKSSRAPIQMFIAFRIVSFFPL